MSGESTNGDSKRLRGTEADGSPVETTKTFRVIPVDHLGNQFPGKHAKVKLGPRVRSQVPYSNVMHEEQGVQIHILSGPPNKAKGVPEDFDMVYPRCGPRAELFFQPDKVRAGIVTCGGLCPGLNSVVRDVTLSLIELYGAKEVLGFTGGWEGIYARPPMVLTPENTNGIQNLGGTVLKSARGGFDLEKILGRLEELEIDQLYVIGGDGTMRGAAALSQGARARSRPIAIVGIPKTIDNDIDLIDRSFGFQTAIEETLRAVRSARVEASCSINGVGIVKVMGRNAGFIATHVALAAGDVDLCLIAEVPIVADRSDQCQFKHVAKVVKERGSAVIVVAEGAGEEIFGKSAQVDAGGNRKLPEIGPWMKDQVVNCLKAENVPCTVKYIDPSYMVRSCPANASDALYCLILSQGAVHTAMAGLTNCMVGLVNGRSVILPIAKVVATSPRSVDPRGRTWERVVSLTGQPHQSEVLPKPDSKGLMSHTVI